MSVKKVESAPKLTPGQYWEWRARHLMVIQKEADLKVASLEKNRSELQQELERMRALLFSTRMNEIKGKLEISRKEFQAVREKIEQELGVTLADKMINETTFELLEVPKEMAPPQK